MLTFKKYGHDQLLVSDNEGDPVALLEQSPHDDVWYFASGLWSLSAVVLVQIAAKLMELNDDPD